LKPVNSIARLLSSEAKSHGDRFGVSSKTNRSFGVRTENHRPIKTFEEVAVDRRMQKNVAADADVENRSQIKVFREVTVDRKASVDRRATSATREPMKTLSNQTSGVSKQASLKHTAGDEFSAVQQCRRCTEMEPVGGGHLEEFISEAETDVGRLSCGLSALELRHIHTRVFCRR